MRFQVGDIVTCPDRQGIGRIERVRVGAGMCRVRWTKNIVSEHSDDELSQVQENSPPPSGSRTWFNPRPLTAQDRELVSLVQAARERHVDQESGQRKGATR
jgi:hypothetical protein